jgi:hypothetical protein
MYYKIILALHVTSGFLALVCGLIAIITKKGSRPHRKAGKIFFYSMLAVPFTAVNLALIKPNQFLLMIGIFAFYLNYAGYRAIKNKSLRPSALDWIILVLSTINILFMVFSMDIILTVFGGVGVYAATRNWIANVKAMNNKITHPKAWLKMHIGMMMGAFTATLTAFLVVNYPVLARTHLPNLFFWFLPAIILFPLSFYWRWKYTGKTKN